MAGTSPRSHAGARWMTGFTIAAVLAATFLRIAAVPMRTVHIDEGMGLRASELALNGEWHYSGANGHGPTLFYLGAAVHALAGFDIGAARLLTAVISSAVLLLLLWSLRRQLSPMGALVLTVALGFSPAFVFYGAYFIHEMPFLLATTATFLAGYAWWKTPRLSHLCLVVIGAALMYASKETAVLTWAAWALAGCVAVTVHRAPLAPLKHLRVTDASIATLLAAIIHIALFTSFFAHPRGFFESLASPFLWFERAQTFHARPFTYFLELLALHEVSLLILAAIGLALCVARRRWSVLLTFLLVWSAAITLIYSLIAYKTPWCIPNLVLPLSLFAAFAVELGSRGLARYVRHCVWGVIAVAAIAGLARSAYDALVAPDRETALSYAYLQSDRSLRAFIDVLQGTAHAYVGSTPMPLQVIGSGDELLHVLTSSYARDYAPFAAGYPVYVNYQSDADELRAKLDATGTKYVRAVFTYIQHVNQIDLFVEQALWDKYAGSPFAIRMPEPQGNVYDLR